MKNDELILENSNLITLCSEHQAMADKSKIPLKEIQNIIKEQEESV